MYLSNFINVKKLILIGLLAISGTCANAQIGVKYDPAIQPTKNMQYFKPLGNLSVGDCMPFYHDGIFSNYWLVDSLHGENLHGLGGHQWVISSTTDLKTWKQGPIVLGIDEPWEKSICTGSIAFYKGKYYAFYATRLIDNGQVNEQLSYAVSNDGVHFDKQKPNPFYKSAPGYSKRDFRDPKVFIDENGEFHLFVASDQENPVLNHASGCLVHLSSKDLKTWTVHDPILTGQPSTPECPDYFYWKGWYYLVYSDNSNTHYVKSKKPYGPWEQPRYQALNEDWANVEKTAEFHDGRRLSVAWIPDRRDNKDNNNEIFGGNMIFREVTQEADGTLDTRFPAEMVPEAGPALTNKIITDLLSASIDATSVAIDASGGVGAAHIEGIPANCRITMLIEPSGPNEEYGLSLLSNEHAENGYRLNFSPDSKIVSLGNTKIEAVDGLYKPITLDVVIKNGIIDVNIDNRRTVVNRTYEQKGSFLWLYAKHGKVNFKSIKVSPLVENN
jgi:sucrose-6-phosphate hydrolase SacC (GH32 family)